MQTIGKTRGRNESVGITIVTTAMHSRHTTAKWPMKIGRGVKGEAISCPVLEW